MEVFLNDRVRCLDEARPVMYVVHVELRVPYFQFYFYLVLYEFIDLVPAVIVDPLPINRALTLTQQENLRTLDAEDMLTRQFGDLGHCCQANLALVLRLISY